MFNAKPEKVNSLSALLEKSCFQKRLRHIYQNNTIRSKFMVALSRKRSLVISFPLFLGHCKIMHMARRRGTKNRSTIICCRSESQTFFYGQPHVAYHIKAKDTSSRLELIMCMHRFVRLSCMEYRVVLKMIQEWTIGHELMMSLWTVRNGFRNPFRRATAPLGVLCYIHSCRLLG